MTTVYVKKINESNMMFDSDEQGVIYEISEAFSFFAPGYKYDRRFRNHMWDGRIHLANARTRLMPLGLIGELKRFCEHYEYDFVDQTEQHMIIKIDPLDDFDSFVSSLNLPFEPRDYQIKAVKHAIEKNRATVISPTGSGKSLIIYLLIRWHLKYDRRFCLIVPTVSLVEQMRSDFENYAKNDPSFNVDEVVQTIGGKKSQGKIVDENKSIITTWQSLQHYDSSFYNSFDVMYVDEAHQATASVLQKIYSSAVNVPHRCGFTGSLDEEKIHHLQLIGSLGDIFVVTTTKELQDNGTLSPLKIHMITCKYPEDESKAFYRANKKDYKAEIDYLNSHLKRNMFIRNIVLASKGTTMLLFNFKVHGAELSRLITEKVKEDGIDRKVFFIDGNVSADEREKIRQAMNEENGCILISSVGTTATGLNIPSIQNVILCPSKSKIRNIQSIGRGLRNDKSSGKESCTVYDLVDDMSYGRHKNYCLKHAMDRLRQYQEQQFDIDFHTVNF